MILEADNGSATWTYLRENAAKWCEHVIKGSIADLCCLKGVFLV